ncbi:MAG: sulfatase-like hydrolase/transferase [Hyphomicrobiales bacterium]
MTRPNVLMICADHWSAGLLGVAGHPAIKTAGLDELAECGTRFTNAYSECPVCIPARRSLMCGQSPRAHGDRVFAETMPMPDVPTLAQSFRDAGYQADAVGKLHVYPQRDRIGFDSVLLEEEGRRKTITHDDYDAFLGERGHLGAQYEHGMSPNQYHWRPWHLSEDTHVTNWAAKSMARTILRRDTTRPAFWYLGFRHPHPPLVPLQTYYDLYDGVEIDPPQIGDWVESAPPAVQTAIGTTRLMTEEGILQARRAFYALCTQIDHQIRYLIGTLKFEGLLDDTIILFTSDHGEMLGNHNMLAKRLFYQAASNVPMILVPNAGNKKIGEGVVDDRLTGLQDVMPTLLDACDIDIPGSCTGRSMLGGDRREHLYGEFGNGSIATRMIRQGDFKLIYYANGNVRQLFDLVTDPHETRDLAGDPAHAARLNQMTELLATEIYGEDADWLEGVTLKGRPEQPFEWRPTKSLRTQRGTSWPLG